jgi:hypothetical protein
MFLIPPHLEGEVNATIRRRRRRRMVRRLDLRYLALDIRAGGRYDRQRWKLA